MSIVHQVKDCNTICEYFADITFTSDEQPNGPVVSKAPNVPMKIESSIDEADDISTSEEVYSYFSKTKKKMDSIRCLLCCYVLPISSFIYYPAISTLAKFLQVTLGLIDLATTSYMVMSGIAPHIIGNLVCQIGRRSVYIVALTVYLIANMGLALQNSYSVLLVLRMVQSVGSSDIVLVAPCTAPNIDWNLRYYRHCLWSGSQHSDTSGKGFFVILLES